jgi:hypothetical protein
VHALLDAGYGAAARIDAHGEGLGDRERLERVDLDLVGEHPRANAVAIDGIDHETRLARGAAREALRAGEGLLRERHRAPRRDDRRHRDLARARHAGRVDGQQPSVAVEEHREEAAHDRNSGDLLRELHRPLVARARDSERQEHRRAVDQGRGLDAEQELGVLRRAVRERDEVGVAPRRERRRGAAAVEEARPRTAVVGDDLPRRTVALAPRFESLVERRGHLRARAERQDEKEPQAKARRHRGDLAGRRVGRRRPIGSFDRAPGARPTVIPVDGNARQRRDSPPRRTARISLEAS